MTSTAVTGITMIQTLSFISAFDYRWPTAMKSLLNVMGTATGGATRALSMQCMAGSSLHHAYAALLVSVLAAPVCGAVCLALVVCWSFTHKTEGNDEDTYTWLHRKGWIVSMCVVFIFQPAAIQGSLTMLTCKDVGSKSLLYSSMDIECWSSSHTAWTLAVAIPSILVYGVALPLSVFLGMRRYFADGIQLDEDEDGIRLYAPLMRNFVTSRPI